MDKRFNSQAGAKIVETGKGKTSYKIMKRYIFQTADGFVTDIVFENHTARISGYLTEKDCSNGKAWGTDSEALKDEILRQTNILEVVDTWEDDEIEWGGTK